jgi:hypothetical protein
MWRGTILGVLVWASANGALAAKGAARTPQAAAAAEAAVLGEAVGRPSLPARLAPEARKRARAQAAQRLGGALIPSLAMERSGPIARALFDAVRALHDAIDAMRAAGGPHPGGVSGAARGRGDAARSVDEAARAAANAAANARRNDARRGAEPGGNRPGSGRDKIRARR